MADEELNEELTDEDVEREKANLALAELIDVFAKYKLRAKDMVVVYGNLGYSLGASIQGYSQEETPTIDELQKSYYSQPTLGIALMLQGILTTSWYDQIKNEK